VAPRNRFLGALSRLFAPARPTPSAPARSPTGDPRAGDEITGRNGASATTMVQPPGPGGLRIGYAPDPDGDPDAGEIVWTWVPYVENDGRGKDRPVLVIARQDAARVFAVRLTSKAHEGDRDFLALGTGPWDARGRPSWVDVDQLYSVHADGMRREASALDRARFDAVAAALQRRYGWSIGG
jgi:mRNA-degrading endonuclease toxin of MazEF toxin-antitoxin module